MVDVLYGPQYCFEDVVRLKFTFHEYAKSDLNRHLQASLTRIWSGGRGRITSFCVAVAAPLAQLFLPLLQVLAAAFWKVKAIAA